MADLKLKEGAGTKIVINKDAALANGSRAAADYDNSTDLDPICDAILRVHYDTSAPAVGDSVAELYVLPSDGAATEVFPQGGDGTVGSNVDPQKTLMVGVFESRSPTTTTDEVLAIQAISLRPKSSRFVIKNISGKQFNLTWQLDIRPFRGQSV